MDFFKDFLVFLCDFLSWRSSTEERYRFSLVTIRKVCFINNSLLVIEINVNGLNVPQIYTVLTISKLEDKIFIYGISKLEDNILIYGIYLHFNTQAKMSLN